MNALQAVRKAPVVQGFDVERIPVPSLKHQLQQRMLAQTGSQP